MLKMKKGAQLHVAVVKGEVLKALLNYMPFLEHFFKGSKRQGKDCNQVRKGPFEAQRTPALFKTVMYSCQIRYVSLFDLSFRL